MSWRSCCQWGETNFIRLPSRATGLTAFALSGILVSCIPPIPQNDTNLAPAAMKSEGVSSMALGMSKVERIQENRLLLPGNETSWKPILHSEDGTHVKASPFTADWDMTSLVDV